MTAKKGFTLSEVLVVCVLTVVVFTSVLGVFVMGKSLYVSSMAGQEAQRDAGLIMSKIIKGPEGGATRYGLRSAAGFTPPTSINSIAYTGADGNARSFYLSSGSIFYQSPTESPTTQTLYSPPANTAVTLWFWEPVTSGGSPVYADHEMLSVYVAVTKTLSAGKTVSGSISTSVNVRNLPK